MDRSEVAVDEWNVACGAVAGRTKVLAADAFAACPFGSNVWFCSRAYDTATQAVSVLQDHHRLAPLVHTPAAFLAASDQPCALPRHTLPALCMLCASLRAWQVLSEAAPMS